MRDFIPVSEPLIGDLEKTYVDDAISKGHLAQGDYLSRFQVEFAHYCGRDYGIATSSGTAALILALQSLELPAGSEVLIPDLTIISCAIACLANGLVPVPVDVDQLTWIMDSKDALAKVTSKTRAIMPVHLFGISCASIEIPFNKYLDSQLFVVEDFSQAIGIGKNRGKCGSMGDISCASFYSNKMVSTGEGGMCLTNNLILANRIKYYGNLCFGSVNRFRHVDLGNNYRMSNIQAAIGLAQLGSIRKRLEIKMHNTEEYRRLLPEFKSLPFSWDHPLWMYPILVANRDRDEVMARLKEKGIETREFFTPISQQPCMGKQTHNPVALEISRRGMYLPSGFLLSDEERARVCEELKAICRV